MDSLYTMQTTINGQLLLTMILERICVALPETKILQANTDGITLMIRKVDRDKMISICHKWEKVTQLELEFCDYEGMVIRDVNNYAAIKKGKQLEPSQPKNVFYDNFYTKHKTKGCFEVVKTKNGKVSYSKNWSQVIVPKALYNYYMYQIPIETTILECEDIFDFCKMYKAAKSPTTGGKLEGIFTNSKGEKIKLTKITRYYLSIDGGKLIKKDSVSGREANIEKGYRTTIYNDHEDKTISDYNIDYHYYIAECNKIINSVERNFQLELEL